MADPRNGEISTGKSTIFQFEKADSCTPWGDSIGMGFLRFSWFLSDTS